MKNQKRFVFYLFYLYSFITAFIFILLFYSFNTINKTKEQNTYILNIKQETDYFLQNLQNKKILPETDEELINSNDIIFEYITNPKAIDNDVETYKEELENASLICNSLIQEKVNNYLEQQRKNNILKEKNSRGIAGRFSSPAVGIDVALFISNSQAVVDARDSAAWFTLGGNSIIADHTNQGFSRIKNMIPGSTVAYIENGTTKTAYICTAKFLGHNTGYDLTDANGISIAGRNTGGLTLYTCNENWQNITIVFLSPI